MADGSCRLASAGGVGKSKMKITDRTPNGKDLLDWKWSKGEAVSHLEFGAPSLSNSLYRVCVYDASGLLSELDIPSGGAVPLCDGKSCWKAGGTGFKYKNKAGTPDGVGGVSLKSGADGKPSIRVKAKGAALDAPATAALSDVVVQLLVREQAGNINCFKTTFPNSGITKQDSTKFSVKGP